MWTVPPDAVLSLHNWIKSDPDSKTNEFELGGSSESGEMGPSIDMLNALITDSTSIGSLLVACLSWRDSRRAMIKSIKVRRGDTEIELVNANQEDCERISEMLAQNEK